MLTGCTYGAEEGQTFGLSHVLVDDGAGLAKGIELAERVADQCAAIELRGHARAAADRRERSGERLLTESLMAAIAQGSDDAKARLKDFLEKRGKKVLRG